MSFKSLFPYFNHNKNVVYLDSAATTQKPESVINAVNSYYKNHNANAHRGNYQSANDITKKYESVRQQVADFINANSAKDIVWTKGTTESINLVAQAWGLANLKAGDNIIVLGSEHHANFVPWQQLAKKMSLNFNVVNILENGMPDMEHYKQLLKLRPKLVAIQHCSNALGNIIPIKQMIDLAKHYEAVTLIDGAQAVAHLEVDVKFLDCDMYVFSAHKMYAPMGLGVLYIHKRIKSQFQPYQYGGEMIQHVSIKESSFRPIPAMLETGTQNISAIIGLGHAIHFLQHEEYQLAKQQKLSMFQYLISQLQNIESVKFFGDQKDNIGVVSFIVEGESITDISTLLDQQGIAIRSGHHCAMPLMTALNIEGTHRVSLGIYNDKQDIDKFISALIRAIELLN